MNDMRTLKTNEWKKILLLWKMADDRLDEMRHRITNRQITDIQWRNQWGIKWQPQFFKKIWCTLAIWFIQFLYLVLNISCQSISKPACNINAFLCKFKR